MAYHRSRSHSGFLRTALVLIGAVFVLLAAGCANLSGTKTIERSETGQVDLPPPAAAPTSWTYPEAPAVPEGMKVVRRLKQVSFPKGSSSLDGEARGALGEAVDLIQTNSAWHLLLVGHTDSFGESAGLAMSRAKAAQSLLTSRGIDASRLHTQSMGSAHAEADEYEKEGQERDRKVEVWAFR